MTTMRTREEIEADAKRNREHPIYGTDFSKPMSVLVEQLRRDMVNIRGRISDMERGYPGWKERIDFAGGGLTCIISALHSSVEEMIKSEIAQGDRERGKSLKFGTRGIGLDVCPGCFVCGGEKRQMSNIAAFVSSREEGTEIVDWFNHMGTLDFTIGARARLDFREHEPNWIQVKVGVCKDHLPNLGKLDKITSVYGRIRKLDIVDAIAVGQRPTAPPDTAAVLKALGGDTNSGD